jgi:hypothetical protein
MAFIVNYVSPIVKTTVTNPVDVGTALLALNAVDEDWARDVGEALDRIQDAIVTIFLNLKAPLPKIDKFEFTDTTGRAAAIIGYYIPGNVGATTTKYINFFSQLTVASSPDPTQATNALTIDPTNFISIAPGIGAIPKVNLGFNGLRVAVGDLISAGVVVNESIVGGINISLFADRVEIALNDLTHVGDYYRNKVTYDGTQVITVRQTGPGNTTDVTDVAVRFNNLLTALRTHGLIT